MIYINENSTKFHLCVVRSLFQMSAADVVFLASPLTFDPSVVEIFLALSSGAQLLIVPNVIKKMPNRLAQLLFKDHRTTVLQARFTSLETVLWITQSFSVTLIWSCFVSKGHTHPA